MTMRGLARRRRGYRRGQSVVLFALAMLVVVACASGPFYERAVEQATTRTTLSSADPIGRGLVIDVGPGVPAADVAPKGPAAHLFGAAVGGTDVPAGFSRGRYSGLSTSITYRDHQCAHLHLTAGHCPGADEDVVASTSSARALGLTVGTRLRVAIPRPGATLFTVALHVVGLYRPFTSDTDYWFGNHYSSRAGITVSSDAVLADAFFATSDYVSAVAARMDASPSDSSSRSFVDVPLRPDAVGVGDLTALRSELARLSTAAATTSATTPGAHVTSALAQYLDAIDAGRRQARTVVLGIALQLALLAVIAFGVVVAAAADQRRPELALVRLRGQTPPRSALVFLREIGSLALLAAVPGLALSWALTLVASRVWLVAGAAPEWRAPVLGAAAASVLVTLAIIAAVGLRTSRRPISDLLRQVPPRTSRAGLGTAEAAVAVTAVAGLVASVGGSKNNALTTVTPTFLAVVIGLLAGRVTVWVAGRAGRRAMWRGAIVQGLAGLSIARRPGARFVITVLCVATALVVFAGQQFGAAGANRDARASAETGAAVVLDVSAATVGSLVGAVRSADPSRRYATPVVTSRAPGVGAVPVVGIDPASFGSVASWGRAQLHPSAAVLRRVVPASTASPISFTGTRLGITIARLDYFALETPPRGTPPVSVSLRVDFRHADGRIGAVTYGPFASPVDSPHRFSAAVNCPDRCRITGIGVVRGALDSTPVGLDVTVASLDAGAALPLGHASDWASVTAPTDLGGGTESMTVRQAPTGLSFKAVDAGGDAAVQHLDVPVGLPALLAGPKPDDIDALGYVTAATPDGGIGRVVVTGTVPFAPQAGDALLVDVELQAQAEQEPTFSSTTLTSVWLGRDDPRREAQLVAALGRDRVVVIARHTSAGLRNQLAGSAPGWSTQLTLVVAVLAFLLGIVLLVLVVMTSRRVRQQDLAALRLGGLSRRRLRSATIAELVVLVVVGIGGGAVAGLVGAHLSLPDIPVFTVATTLPLPETFPVQVTWLAGGLVLSSVLLVGTALTMAVRLVDRATADRVAREAVQA